jgi:hypothetical protein
VDRSGNRRTLLEGLPSGLDPTGSPLGPSALVLLDRTLYIAITVGDVHRFGARPGSIVPNPAGPSSPILSSLLVARFSAEPDSLSASFSMTPADHFRLADGFDLALQNSAGATAAVQLLADFRDVVPDPETIVRESNPYGLVVEGEAIYVADAGLNTVVRVDRATGRWQTLARIAPLPNPAPGGPPVVDCVPTTLRSYGDSLLVTCLSGFPFAPETARAYTVHKTTGAITPFFFWLSAATDILPASTGFYVLEFSANLGAATAPPGRLLRYNSPVGRVFVDNLITPTSMAEDPATGDLFVTEYGPGRIIRVKTR